MRMTLRRARIANVTGQVRVATRGSQGRFLLLTLLSWSTARVVLLWPTHPMTLRALPTLIVPAHAGALRRYTVATIEPAFPPTPASTGAKPRETSKQTHPLAAVDGPYRLAGDAPANHKALTDSKAVDRFAPGAEHPALAEPAPAALFPSQSARTHKIEVQAYVFWRPGGNTPSLAERGELGGSQFAARIALPLGHGLAAVARAYAPMQHAGAEAALGLDWHPLPGQPIRISIERRQRLDALGRSAWSAYAAGGFYRGGAPGHAVMDGYAQAGFVGTQRRDLFVDGALRIGYRLPTARIAVTIGAGLWGAAQPQVSRLDAGPHIAVVLPLERHSLTVQLDGRLRAAGNARPGSGTALTVAADF